MMVTDVQIAELTAHFKQKTIAGHGELGGHLENSPASLGRST